MTANQDYPSESVAEVAPDDDYGIRVDGNLLVLPSGCTLPPLCIKTNQPVTERDMIFANLCWRPNSIAAWWFLGPLPLIIAYMVGSQQCAITYGIAPSVYRRRVLLVLGKILLSIALLAATIFLAVSESTNRHIGPAITVLFVLFLISVVAIFFGNAPIRVVRHENQLFWIKGISQEYLNSLEL